MGGRRLALVVVARHRIALRCPVTPVGGCAAFRTGASAFRPDRSVLGASGRRAVNAQGTEKARWRRHRHRTQPQDHNGFLSGNTMLIFRTAPAIAGAGGTSGQPRRRGSAGRGRSRRRGRPGGPGAGGSRAARDPRRGPVGSRSIWWRPWAGRGSPCMRSRSGTQASVCCAPALPLGARRTRLAVGGRGSGKAPLARMAGGHGCGDPCRARCLGGRGCRDGAEAAPLSARGILPGRALTLAAGTPIL